MIIYCITNLVNDFVYIGKQKNKNEKYFGSGLLIRRAIKKYSIKNFKKQIICKCSSLEEMNLLEIFWIYWLRQDGYNLYNISSGGDWGDTKTNNPNRNDIIEKARKTAKTKYASGEIQVWNKNKKNCFSKETLKKKSESMMGKGKGKKMSKSFGIKISQKLIGKPSKIKGIKKSKAHCKNISIASKNRIKMECKSCYLILDKSNHDRWHGEKCEKNLNSERYILKQKKKEIKLENIKNRGKVRSQKIKEGKIIIWCKGQTKETNIILKEAGKKISIAKKGIKINLSEEQREKRRKIQQENNHFNIKKIKCEYCYIVTNAGNYNRWHGDNCKLKVKSKAA